MINKNKKKYVILFLVMFAATVGFTLTPIYTAEKATDSLGTDELGATTYTTPKLYFEYQGNKDPRSLMDYKINDKNWIKGVYIYPNNTNYYMPNRMDIWIAKDNTNKVSDYTMTKAVVTFKKTVNGQTSYSTKTFTGDGFDGFNYSPKNDYKPDYAVISYKQR